MIDGPLAAQAIDPYCGGSHRAFFDDLAAFSRHNWTFYCGEARFWKWRMRSYPLTLLNEQLQAFRHDTSENKPKPAKLPSGLMVTSMLDLPAYRGLLASKLHEPRLGPKRRDFYQHLLQVPTAVYFHENQLTYPISPHAREDSHYGYTNILSAMLADEIWFNSDFHRSNFLEASESFIRRMPDQQKIHPIKNLAQKSFVVAPGFRPIETGFQVGGRCSSNPAGSYTNPPIRIGWVARWEYDKRPDHFLELLRIIRERRISFELILLGPRRESCEELRVIETEFQNRILYSGHADSQEEYRQQLSEMDIVVSTADHEYFGIAVCEAVSAGAVPVLPARLAYTEIAVPECLYRQLDEAVDLISELTNPEIRTKLYARSRKRIQHLSVDRCIQTLDERFSEMVANHAELTD